MLILLLSLAVWFFPTASYIGCGVTVILDLQKGLEEFLSSHQVLENSETLPLVI